MYVTKRNQRKEEVNLEKITTSVSRVCEGFEGVDYYRIASKTIGGLYDGVTTKELDQLSIQTSVGFISEDPVYSKVAARLLSNYMKKEVENQDIHSFSQSIKSGYEQGLISEETYKFVEENKRKLNNAIKTERNDFFEYYGLRIVYDRYLLKHPQQRLIIETPQYWFLRVACGLADDVKEAIEFYNLISSLEYMPSTPTLFNSGTNHSQMSSCYLLDSPLDDLYDIYKKYQDIAMLSKWAGGIGVSMSRIRSNGELIKGTNGKSNGIIPWIHTLDASVAGVNQGGKRKGAACVYLETWHPDIFDFLELRDNTGDKEKRAHNLNIANWIPDLFMKRVQADELWSLFGTTVAPELVDLFGEQFEKRYLELEQQEKYTQQIPARKLYARMMRTLAETGNGWICFKDSSNLKCNSAVNGNVVHLSNLCLAPDTIIRAIVDGEEVDITIELLSQKFRAGSEVAVYSFNEETEEFEWKPVLNAGITNYNAEIIEVETDDGIIIECTEEHLFLTKNRGWIKAGELEEFDILINPELKPVHNLEMWNLGFNLLENGEANANSNS